MAGFCVAVCSSWLCIFIWSLLLLPLHHLLLFKIPIQNHGLVLFASFLHFRSFLQNCEGLPFYLPFCSARDRFGGLPYSSTGSNYFYSDSCFSASSFFLNSSYDDTVSAYRVMNFTG
jgi:hypothetical protein